MAGARRAVKRIPTPVVAESPRDLAEVASGDVLGLEIGLRAWFVRHNGLPMKLLPLRCVRPSACVGVDRSIPLAGPERIDDRQQSQSVGGRRFARAQVPSIARASNTFRAVSTEERPRSVHDVQDDAIGVQRASRGRRLVAHGARIVTRRRQRRVPRVGRTPWVSVVEPDAFKDWQGWISSEPRI
jgi:hypothetical protein